MDRKQLPGTSFLVILAAPCLMYLCCCAPTPTDPDAWRTEEDLIGAYLMIQDFVEDRLISPASAKFPWDARKHVTPLGNRRYRVHAYVDSQNGFGAMIRTHFTGEIEQLGPDRWKLHELTLDN